MRTITIKGSLGRFDDGSPFLVESGALELKAILPDVSGEFFLVAELNGKTDKLLIPHSGTVVIRDLEAGELRAEIKHYLRGALIKVYKIEPLLLKEVDGNIAATPELTELTSQIEKLETAFNEFIEEKKREDAEARARIHATDVKLLGFLWADYEKNLFVNSKSLPFTDFLSACGFDIKDFTEDDIKQIQATKEVL